MEKDNVLVEEQVKTEREETMSGMENAKDGKGSAVLKKFKDENALAKAYGELEAEFTRRSQKLKALERELANLQAEKPVSVGEVEGVFIGDNAANSSTGGEALVEPTDESSIKESGSVGDEATNAESVGEELGKRSLDGASAFEKIDKESAVESIAQKVSDEEIYERASGNEEIRLKIIGDYFASLKKSSTPLIRGGQGTIVSPNTRAMNVSQAGDMALRYFKTEKTQK